MKKSKSNPVLLPSLSHGPKVPDESAFLTERTRNENRKLTSLMSVHKTVFTSAL